MSVWRNKELILAMIKLGMPYRVGFAISTALRMVPTIASSIYTISQAQRSRGLDLESGNVIERIRKDVPSLIPVFISTIRGTNAFGVALETKGFGAGKDRTFYLKMETRDYITLAFSAAVVIVCLYLGIIGYGIISGLAKF
jgi:energy-coupling factor transport system permease protein